MDTDSTPNTDPKSVLLRNAYKLGYANGLRDGYAHATKRYAELHRDVHLYPTLGIVSDVRMDLGGKAEPVRKYTERSPAGRDGNG